MLVAKFCAQSGNKGRNMSKIGRKSINIRDIQVSINDRIVTYKGKNGSGVYELPQELEFSIQGDQLSIRPSAKGSRSRDVNRVWGLHRALFSNKLQGVRSDFECQLEIVGLGFKAAATGRKIVLSLGYSHKIDFELPNNVNVETDKTGQLLTIKSSDKELVGQVCSNIKLLRSPEPYKGTGIKYKSETLLRKAGKTKSA